MVSCIDRAEEKKLCGGENGKIASALLGGPRKSIDTFLLFKDPLDQFLRWPAFSAKLFNKLSFAGKRTLPINKDKILRSMKIPREGDLVGMGKKFLPARRKKF